jgi:GNAT superfamily N-acetyltransferase
MMNITLETYNLSPRFLGAIIRKDGVKVGSGEIEFLREGYCAPHVSVYPDYQRQGVATRFVDIVRDTANTMGLELIWEDDPKYRPLGGVGCFSPDGKQFADAYRRNLNRSHYVGRSLALPAI